MICVEVTETGVSLSKVASDMPKLAKTMLKKAVSYAKTRAEHLTSVRSGLMPFCTGLPGSCGKTPLLS